MSRVILQVPMTRDLKVAAQAAVSSMGFFSLQESIRVWLTQIIRYTPVVRYEEPAERLSKRAATRYEKMIKDIESGKVKTKSFTSVDAMMKELRS